MVNKTHGMSYYPEYRVWYLMQHRCLREGSYYQRKGIKVCDRWINGADDKSGLECFMEDMGPRPSKQHSIDRWPNNDGNYEPSNCRWATKKEQGWSISITKKGKSNGPHSVQTREKIARANRARAWKQIGVRFSEETRKKMSIARTGKKFSEETKTRMREARKIWWESKKC